MFFSYDLELKGCYVNDAYDGLRNLRFTNSQYFIFRICLNDISTVSFQFKHRKRQNILTCPIDTLSKFPLYQFGAWKKVRQTIVMTYNRQLTSKHWLRIGALNFKI